MNNTQKPSELFKMKERQRIRAKLNKMNTKHIDISALSFEFNKFNFAGSDYNISTQNLQGTDSNQPFNAWDSAFKKN